MKNVIFDELNERQIEAVQIVNGPVMAVAGAGSGKTRVLTNRIAYLIDEIGIPPSHILAITFTNRAAEEMRNRVFQLIDLPLKGMWISTFHAMGAKILRNDIHHLDYDNNFQIIDDKDSEIITKNILKDLNYDIKQYSPRLMYGLIEAAKADRKILEIYPEPIRKVLNAVFPVYVNYLKNNNLVDFQDLLVLVLDLFRNFPEVLKKYQEWFEYVLVDEFQDTNDLQYEIVYLLAKNHQNLFIVGDEDQSIYAFRGSNIENIKKFMDDFPTHKKIILNQNYRSKENILKAANAVIKNNKNRIPKDLFSELGEGEKVIHFKADSDEEEAYYIYNKIKSLHKEGYSFEDMAILYRNNAMSRKFEDILLKYNIPHKVIGNISFYKRKEIKDIIAYLHLLINLGDDFSFSRIYNEPKRGIGESSFIKLKEFAHNHNLKLMDVIDSDLDFVSSHAASRLIDLKSSLLSIQINIEEVNLLTTYDDLLQKTGYLKMLQNEDLSVERKIEAERRIENIQEFKTIILEKIRDYDVSVSNYEKLVQILTDLALREEAEDLLQDEKFVSLMTVHSAKGLEFKIVFVACLEQSLFPSSQSLLERADVEEERRLFYVALTRTKELAVLTSSRTRFMYGRFMENLDSQFLSEIDEDTLLRQGLAKPKEIVFEKLKQHKNTIINPKVSSNYEKKDLGLTIGDKIVHQVFGNGVIVAISEDKATIAFQKEVGIKVLMKDHPSINKVR
ncbi:MAG: UvrD-helicase domain-containing protein [Firmicutes bacterium]|nr:UvrD-helicase domain-containing protein [Bacillota bacterium]